MTAPAGDPAGADAVRAALKDAVEVVRAHSRAAPRCAIVLGSGLGGLADEIDPEAVVPYRAIPHFPLPTAAGHAGELVLGRLDGRPVAALRGRVHLYEGYTPQQVVFPVRLLAVLGAPVLILSNAAGGLNPAFHRGDLMLLADHINFTGTNPLAGPNDDRLGPRFPDMSAAYDPSLRALAESAARAEHVALRAGVYAGVLGPSYETPAEIRMLRAMGADAVGMSTVLETIAARHAGVRVLGIAVITNAAAGGPAAGRHVSKAGAKDGTPVRGAALSHEDVLSAAAAAGPRLVSVVRRFVRDLPGGQTRRDV
ncbi:MAG TPA: purine-nucleoside phosphorylase [bacterium]|nr:purine-nucleoside phosphorylase [bacterium]